jgi:hypothetical protein
VADWDGNGDLDVWVSTTAADGSFSLMVSDARTAAYDVFVLASGYAPSYVPRAFSCTRAVQPHPQRITMSMSSAYTRVNVTVKDAQTLQARKGAVVSEVDVPGGILGVTDSNGVVHLDLLSSPAAHCLWVRWRSSQSYANEIALDGTSPQNITLFVGTSGVEVWGKVRDHTGAEFSLSSFELRFVRV